MQRLLLYYIHPVSYTHLDVYKRQLSLTGNGVLVGFVDSGIDLTHPDFQDSNGNSRVLFLWDQTRDEDPPDGYLFGTEYNNEQINEALRAGKTLTKDESGHGTAAAGIACGNGNASKLSLIHIFWIKLLCLKHWNEILVAKLTMLSICLNMVLIFWRTLNIHIAGIPLTSKCRHTIHTPMNKNSKLFLLVPIWCLIL